MKDRKPLAIAVLTLALVGIVVSFEVHKVHAADQRPVFSDQDQKDLLRIQVEYKAAEPIANQAAQAAFQKVMKPIDDEFSALTNGKCNSKGKEQYTVFIPPKETHKNPGCYTQAEIKEFNNPQPAATTTTAQPPPIISGSTAAAPAKK